MSTIVSAEEKLGALSNNQAELLKLLLEKKSRQSQTLRPFPRAAGINEFPASWAQQRLWFIDQLEGGNAAYHMTVVARLHGPLNAQTLQKVLDALVRRHEALRTVFASVNGEPTQKILPSVTLAVPVIDLTGYEEHARQAHLQCRKTEEANGPFDLAAGPLIRGRLLKLHPEEHVLLITMHHIISDGWSMGVLLGEISHLICGV